MSIKPPSKSSKVDSSLDTVKMSLGVTEKILTGVGFGVAEPIIESLLLIIQYYEVSGQKRSYGL